MVKDGKFGRMAALRGTEIIDIPIQEAVESLKTVGDDFYDVARTFFR